MNVPNPLAQFLDAPDPVYGTGMDGDATLNGSSTVLGMIPVSNVYNMTRDMYFNNLTIGDGVRLQPDGFRIFVKNTLTLGSNSRIGFITGYTSILGSIAQGGGIGQAVTNSLGGASATQTATVPAASLGGSNYYRVPQQAIRGWAVSVVVPSPTFLRGGAGGVGQPGGGIVILAARYITVSSGTATISAPATAPAGGGVLLIVSSYESLPAAVSTDVTGQNPGTVHYMQLV